MVLTKAAACDQDCSIARHALFGPGTPSDSGHCSSSLQVRGTYLLSLGEHLAPSCSLQGKRKWFHLKCSRTPACCCSAERRWKASTNRQHLDWLYVHFPTHTRAAIALRMLTALLCIFVLLLLPSGPAGYFKLLNGRAWTCIFSPHSIFLWILEWDQAYNWNQLKISHKN